MIDWGATGAMLQGIGSIAGAIAVVVGGVLASRTLKTWKSQRISEIKREHAEKILVVAYKARQHLRIIRNPVMAADEFSLAEDHLRECNNWIDDASDETKIKIRSAQAYYNRLNKSLDIRKEIDNCLPYAAAMFSSEVEENLIKLNQVFHKVRNSVDFKFRRLGVLSEDQSKRVSINLYEGYHVDGVNEVDNEIMNAVKSIENSCSAALWLK